MMCVCVLVVCLACHACAHATYCDKILVVGDNAVRHCDSSKSKSKSMVSVVSVLCVFYGRRRVMC